MNPLPSVTEGLVIPPEQPISEGKAGDYVGIYVLGEEPRIVVALTNPFLKFGRTECWSPSFECVLPVSTEPTEERGERFFQIAFTGIPGRVEEFHRTGLCIRSVNISVIRKMFEGFNPPTIR